LTTSSLVSRAGPTTTVKVSTTSFSSIRSGNRIILDLINKLCNLVRGYYTEADQVFSGRGDLQLLPANAKHRVTVDMWKSLSVAQQQKANDECFRQTIIITSSTSTDSKVLVPTMPGAGKKPKQQKR